MPKIRNTVLVREIPGEPFRYYVESWERPGFDHVVDLLELHGNGECDCHDFVRCRKNYNEGGAKPIPYLNRDGIANNRTQCKHIEAARRFLLKQLLAKLSEDRNGTTD